MSELAIPEASALVRPAEIYALEMDIHDRVRDMGLEVLVPVVDRINQLAKALAKTDLNDPAMAAARRVEWQIGRLLGPATPGEDGWSSLASDLPPERVYEFRQIASLELPWDEMERWAKSRARLLKLAKERNRTPLDEPLDIRRGDFRQVLADLDDGSVDLILTDPPYAEKVLPLYGELAEFAARVLVPGGSLVSYVGQSTMPAAAIAFSGHLRYWWCLALDHRGGGQQLPGKWVRIKWKPILWFVKGERRDKTYVHDMIRGTTEGRGAHEWAQGVDEVLPLIESLTDPEQLVCDPFAGSGSFGIAAHKIGRRFIGADDREEEADGA